MRRTKIASFRYASLRITHSILYDMNQETKTEWHYCTVCKIKVPHSVTYADVTVADGTNERHLIDFVCKCH